MQPLFQTNFLGTITTVFPDHVEYKMLSGLAGTLTLPLAQISSVHASLIIFWKVVVETAGGQRYHLFVNPFYRGVLVKTILAQLKKSGQ